MYFVKWTINTVFIKKWCLFQTVAFPANEVRIEIDTTNTDEDYEIDAIKITGQCWFKGQALHY